MVVSEVTVSSEGRTVRENGSASDPTRGSAGALHRPWRALVALIELLVIGLAVWGAFALWSRGVLSVVTWRGEGADQASSTRYLGHWIAGSIALGALASVLLLDAVREMLLAVATRRFRRRNPERVIWPEGDDDADAG